MSSDGLRHEAEMEAPSKDDVYVELRKRGIRAIKVTERIQPIVKKGFSGLRKRDWCLICGAAVLLVGCVVFSTRHSRLGKDRSQVDTDALHRHDPRVIMASDPVEIRLGDRIAKARPRRQIEIDTGDIKVFFPDVTDRYLVRFAVPGRALQPDDASELQQVSEDVFDALDTEIVIREDDPKGVADLKGIVAGIKDEVRMLLMSGKDFAEVVEWLHNRQSMEADYRKRLIDRYPNDEAEANRQLKTLGMAGVGE